MRRVLLVVAGLVLGCVLTEIGLRVALDAETMRHYDTASPVENSRWVGHPFTPYAGRPNGRYELSNDTGQLEVIELNSYGFRTHEFDFDKQPGDLVVLAFGGSTTYGYKASSNQDTWPARLERMLAERYPGRRVRVYNMGVDMATTAVSVVNLALIGVHLRPDLVIVHHGYNDLAAVGAANFRTDHAHFYGDLNESGLRRGVQTYLPPRLRESALLRLITGAIDHRSGTNDLAAEVAKPREPDENRFKGLETTLGNFATIDSMARGRGARTLFATFQFRDPAPEYATLNDTLRKFFSANGIEFVDQAELIPDGDPEIHVDICHFTPRGREMVARNFFDAIVERGLVAD